MNAAQNLQALAATSFDFADVLRSVLPEFVIWPAQALDTAQVRPRAKFTLRLSAMAIPVVVQGDENPVPLDVHGVLDLFEPPQHIRHMAECLAMKRSEPRLTLREIARRMGINYMTVKRSLDYARRMLREQLSEPYREVLTEPRQASRWRRRRKALAITAPSENCGLGTSEAVETGVLHPA